MSTKVDTELSRAYTVDQAVQGQERDPDRLRELIHDGYERLLIEAAKQVLSSVFPWMRSRFAA